MGYKVKIQSFEGPVDLLVYLIENAQMSIYDIEISSITRQYLDYIEAMQDMDIAVSTEFMVLASSLIEIKSKMILPRIRAERSLWKMIREASWLKESSNIKNSRRQQKYCSREKKQLRIYLISLRRTFPNTFNSRMNT